MDLLLAQGQTLPHRRYTTRDGLVADRITVITQDNNGFMWMGSLFGLSKYDGNKFVTIDLPPSQKQKYISTLLSAGEKLYAGFLFGGGLMEYEKGRITSYYIPGKAGENDIVGLYKSGEGVLAVNSQNKVYLFNAGVFKFLFSLDSSYSSAAISSLVSDGEQIWAGTTNGLKIYRNGKLINTILSAYSVLSIQKTANGILVASAAGGKTIFQLFDVHDPQPANSRIIWESSYFRPISFYSNQPGSFWGLDIKRGLVNIRDAGLIDFYAPASDLQTEIKYLFADRENNLWMASDPGVLKISNTPAISYEFEELAPGGADIVQTSDSVLWAINSKYLYTVSNNKLLKAPEFRDKQNMDFLGIMFFDNSGHLWISGWTKGLWRLKYGHQKLISRNYIDNFDRKKIIVNCVTQDNRGNTWAGGPNGIFHIRDDKIIDHFSFSLNDTTASFITAITVNEKKNEIWVGDNSHGVIKISCTPSGEKFIYHVAGHFGKEDGLFDTQVRSLFADSNDNIWIGTRLGGIYRMHTQPGGHYGFQHFNTVNGLTCMRVTDIAEEKGQAVWFATCDGIFRFTHSSGQWRKYSVSEGLLAAENFSLSIDKDKQRVWAVSGQGITNLIFKDLHKQKPAPLVNITGISVLGREDSAALFSEKEKKLYSDQNSIGFVFAAASFTDERNIWYKFMLSGYDKDWSTPVKSNYVNYVSLPSGRYTFKVLASVGDGDWSGEPASFSFHIIRPFYQSFWFIGSIVFLVFIAFYLIHLYRLKQKLKLEQLRLNIARDLHDDIGSALGSINLLSETASRRLVNNPSVEEVGGVFQKIGHSAQNVLDAMDDIIWAINPEKDHLEDLLVRMREFAIPLLEAKNIEPALDINAGEGVNPSMELKRNIYLVFKEAIYNIVRHSGSTSVKIKILFDAKNFDIIISDNGKGFDENTPIGRNGLRNLKKRAGLSGAELTISSMPGQGTTIRFHGPVR